MIELRASLDDLYESQVAHAYKGDTVIKVRPSKGRKVPTGRPWYEDDKELFHQGEDDDNYGEDDYSENDIYEAFLRSEHLCYEDFVDCICSDPFSEGKAAKRGIAAEGAKAEFLNEEQSIFQTTQKLYPQKVGYQEFPEELADASRKTVSHNSGSTHSSQYEGASGYAADVDTAPLLKCPKCEVTFANQLDLDSHVMGSDPDTACGRVCGDQTALGAYMLAAHSVDQDEKLPCKYCDDIYPTQQKLDHHISNEHSDDNKAARALKAEEKQRAENDTLSVNDDFQHRDQMRLADENWALEASLRTSQAEQAARKALPDAIDKLAYRIEKLTESTNSSHNELVRLFSESIQQQKEFRAAHDQCQKEAMQTELEALNLQEALIAARKRKLLVKMSR
jgi:uncharacterized C2H2 Zn-finger protein